MEDESAKNLKMRKEGKLKKDDMDFSDSEDFEKEAEKVAKAMWKVINSKIVQKGGC